MATDDPTATPTLEPALGAPPPESADPYADFALSDAPAREEESGGSEGSEDGAAGEGTAQGAPPEPATAEPAARSEPAKVEPPAKTEEPATGRPAPSEPAPKTYTPAEFDRAVQSVDEQLDALAQRYEDGEIPFKDYRKEERKLSDQRQAIHDLRRQQESREAQTQREWQGALSSFFGQDENKPFGSAALAPLMREAIQAQWADPASAVKPYAQVLADAAAGVRATLRQALGIADAPAAGAAAAPLPKEVADLKAARETRLRQAQATPGKGTRAPSQADPYEGFAAD